MFPHIVKNLNAIWNEYLPPICDSGGAEVRMVVNVMVVPSHNKIVLCVTLVSPPAAAGSASGHRTNLAWSLVCNCRRAYARLLWHPDAEAAGRTYAT
ncbi:MAG: hypothetical protein ABFD54_06860 [Armatimonadota bacterium]|nr:hypothetical protein [bacterium]